VPNIRLSAIGDPTCKHVLIYKVEGLTYPNEAEVVEISKNEWRIRHANAEGGAARFEDRTFNTPEEALAALQAEVDDFH
jgi:hypothetical protein